MIAKIGLWSLFRNEIIKAVRRKLPYFGLFGVALICILVSVVVDQFDQNNETNGWGYVTLSMQLVFADIGLIFVIIFSALLMSEETRSGTIRALLASPHPRWRFYYAKTLTGLLYMVVLSVLTLVLSIGLAKLEFGFGAVADDFGEVYSRTQVLGNFLFATVLSWIPLAAMVCYGLLISTLVRSPGAAVGAAIGTVYIIDFTKHLVGLDPYIFTRYITYPWQVMHQVAQGVDYQWQPGIWKMLGLCCANGMGLYLIGLILFTRQDLND